MFELNVQQIFGNNRFAMLTREKDHWFISKEINQVCMGF